MRIREIGKTLHLIRYAGYDNEGKKAVEAKIGAIGKYCLPIVLDHDVPTDSNDGVSKSLWRKLTIEEQEKLLVELTSRQVELAKARFRLTAGYLEQCTAEIDAVTPELAARLWDVMGEFQKALKKAGHPKPHNAAKTGEKAPSGSQDTQTIPMALDVPSKA